MHPLFDTELQQKIINIFKNDPYNLFIKDTSKEETILNEIDEAFKLLRSEYPELKFKTNLQYLIGEKILELKERERFEYRLTHEYIKTNLFVAK